MQVTNKVLTLSLIIAILSSLLLSISSYAETSLENPYVSYYYLLSSVPATIEAQKLDNNASQKFTPFSTITLHKNQLLALELKTNNEILLKITTSHAGLIIEEKIMPNRLFFYPLTTWVTKDISLSLTIEVSVSEKNATLELVLKTFQLVLAQEPKDTVNALSFYEGKENQVSIVGILLPPINVQAVLQVTINPIPSNVSFDNLPLQKSPDGKIRLRLSRELLFIELRINGSISWVSAIVRYFYYLSNAMEKQSTDVLLGVLSVLLFLVPLALRHRSLQNTSKRTSKSSARSE